MERKKDKDLSPLALRWIINENCELHSERILAMEMVGRKGKTIAIIALYRI